MLKTDESYDPTNTLLEFELSAFNPETNEGKLRVLFKTKNEIWRFVTKVPSTLLKETGNIYVLVWNTQEGKFSISVDNVLIFENVSISEHFDAIAIADLDEVNRCDRTFSMGA